MDKKVNDDYCDMKSVCRPHNSMNCIKKSLSLSLLCFCDDWYGWVDIGLHCIVLSQLCCRFIQLWCISLFFHFFFFYNLISVDVPLLTLSRRKNALDEHSMVDPMWNMMWIRKNFKFHQCSNWESPRLMLHDENESLFHPSMQTQQSIIFTPLVTHPA